MLAALRLLWMLPSASGAARGRLPPQFSHHLPGVLRSANAPIALEEGPGQHGRVDGHLAGRTQPNALGGVRLGVATDVSVVHDRRHLVNRRVRGRLDRIHELVRSRACSGLRGLSPSFLHYTLSVALQSRSKARQLVGSQPLAVIRAPLFFGPLGVGSIISPKQGVTKCNSNQVQ